MTAAGVMLGLSRWGLAKGLAAVLAAGAIVYPLFHFVPKFYQWILQDRMGKLYRRLRDVDEALQRGLTGSQVADLQTDLENIDQVARILPRRHSELFFDFNRHIESTARVSPRVSLRRGPSH